MLFASPAFVSCAACRAAVAPRRSSHPTELPPSPRHSERRRQWLALAVAGSSAQLALRSSRASAAELRRGKRRSAAPEVRRAGGEEVGDEDWVGEDPGRREAQRDFSGPGLNRLRLSLSCGGDLAVSSNAASEQSLPSGAAPGSRQEWRSLRFIPSAEAGDPGPAFIQSVAKVTLLSPGPDQVERAAVADPRVLGLNYPKTLAAAIATSLSALGHLEQPRILCIGLGAGSVPLWLAHHVANSWIDVVELEPSVLKAAREAMGFCGPLVLPEDSEEVDAASWGGEGSRRGVVRAIQGDGAAYAMACAREIAKGRSSLRYDAVVVDAYDSLDRVPESLTAPDGPLAKALPQILRRPGPDQGGGFVVANLPPGFPVRQLLKGYGEAMGSSCRGVSLQVPEILNSVALLLQGSERGLPTELSGIGDEGFRLDGKLSQGRGWGFRDVLVRAAEALAWRRSCSFDIVGRLMVCEAQEWVWRKEKE